ncbi:cystathionine beta-synthase/cysteine synthase A [Bacillus sp. OV322]|uniref:cysteine synthase family protein n=1 Tax=Bacillus sp. OV322 TaxID=1882764 RepID=UPI0008E46019|nr:cysteine synthase family protein [Bacillus sp. OV322]SFC35210.1 cystathionine beta-synthase/cysteine synthase A [Bacillus sp. OV322]
MALVTDLVGNTPYITLQRLTQGINSNIHVKIERGNPAGSIKDRPALYLIEQAEKEGLIKPGDTIIESSSGNFGISLAMIGASKGYKVIILVDPKTTQANLSMLKAFGAEIIVVTEQDDSGSYHKTRIKLANELHKKIENSFRPDQCFNPNNADAHYYRTGPEIAKQFPQGLDAIVIAVSTGGQTGGISRFFKENYPNTKIIAVDAVGSSIFSGQEHSYLLPGMGLSWTPANIENIRLIDEIYKVPDESAFMACRTLARQEGILVGGSTGASLMAAMKIAQSDKLENILCIASDSGERYLDTIYNDAWMETKVFNCDTTVHSLMQRVSDLSIYSNQPDQVANYKPELIDILGSPSKNIIQKRKSVAVY